MEELEDRIDERDIDYFSDYPELHDEIANQKERAASAFNSWDPFKILHGIDYRWRATDCLEHLETLAEFLQSELNLAKCDYHTASFDHNNNFGTDLCWVALYPQEAADHQAAHQTFLCVTPAAYEQGIVSGGRVEDGVRDLYDIPADPALDVETMLERYEELLPRFNRLNQALLFDKPKREEQARDDHPLNLILYGPPGTGKTHSVQHRSVQIIEGTIRDLTDEEISDRFRSCLDDGQIEFTTFHPSYAYEEFVEGLRYDPDQKIPVVQDGILKRLAERALNPRPNPKRSDSPRIWKLSLGRQGNDEIYRRCMEAGEIAIGFVHGENMEGLDEDAIANRFAEHGRASETNNINTVHQFVNELHEGDYVAVYDGPRSIRAIGVVTGPYQFKRNEYDDYPHIRPVDWLDQSVHDICELNGSTHLTRKTLYTLDRIALDDFLELLPNQGDNPKPHVLIIDEINRGNLARVFGELITLLEPDKRKGQPNEISARLPYSQERLTLPANLYVIGTMNTADRSIALLDAALRRRFEFREVMPNVQVIRDHLTARVDADGSDETQGASFDLSEENITLISEVFTTLNERITALLDRDHQVGHSYFLGVTSMADVRDVWYHELLPLLQEYFYDDQRRLTSLLGQYDQEAQRGFVETRAPASLHGDGSAMTEEIWEFHKYQTGELATALRNTFAA
jgi:5-methylcytosine-specific restriction protein B